MQHWTKKTTVKIIHLLDNGDYTVKTESISEVEKIEFKDTHVMFYLTRGRIKAIRADHVLDVETEIVQLR